MQFQATTDICLQEYLFVEMVMNPELKFRKVMCVILFLCLFWLVFVNDANFSSKVAWTCKTWGSHNQRVISAFSYLVYPFVLKLNKEEQN